MPASDMAFRNPVAVVPFGSSIYLPMKGSTSEETRLECLPWFLIVLSRTGGHGVMICSLVCGQHTWNANNDDALSQNAQTCRVCHQSLIAASFRLNLNMNIL